MQVCCKAWEPAFLTSSQMQPLLLVGETHTLRLQSTSLCCTNLTRSRGGLLGASRTTLQALPRTCIGQPRWNGCLFVKQEWKFYFQRDLTQVFHFLGKEPLYMTDFCWWLKLQMVERDLAEMLPVPICVFSMYSLWCCLLICSLQLLSVWAFLSLIFGLLNCL